MEVTERPSKKPKKFSLLDDFEAGNTSLGDIIELKEPSAFNFNDYLVQFALNRSNMTEVVYQPARLDFGKVKKLDVDSEPGDTTLEETDDELEASDLDDFDMQVRSSKFDNVKDSQEHLEADFGVDLHEFVGQNHDDMMLDEIFDREKQFDDLEFEGGDENSGSDDDMDVEYPFEASYGTSMGGNQPQIFEDHGYYRDSFMPTKSPGRVCSPEHRKLLNPGHSTIHCRKNLLNLIVESSDGNLDDATKYATEINSQNSSGIPLPEKTTELVTIPTTGPSSNGIRKAAIVRATMAMGGTYAGSIKKRVGFYTAGEKQEFVQLKDKENEAPLTKQLDKPSRRRVQWANTLEW